MRPFDARLYLECWIRDLLNQGNTKQAIDVINAEMAFSPTKYPRFFLRRLRAKCYRKLGLFHQAIEDNKWIMDKLEEDDEDFHLEMAWCWEDIAHIHHDNSKEQEYQEANSKAEMHYRMSDA